MTRWNARICLIAFTAIVASLAASAVHAQSREEVTMETASTVLDEIMAVPLKEIPQSMFKDAEAIAIIPNVIKGGFVVGVRHGRGVVLIRGEGGAWQAPQFISLTGGSVGFQAGVQATDVVLVFKSKRSVEGLMSGKFTIGADAAAAAGPVGRQAAAATDERLKAEIYSYSRSRGLFAGVSLDGSVLEIDRAADAAYYRDPSQLPPAAAKLMERVAFYATRPLTPAEASSVIGPVGEQPLVVGPQVVGPQAVENENAQVAALRARVAQSSMQMQPLLDPRWQAYLALPQEAYGEAGHPQLDLLQQALNRYTAVAENAAYRNLTQRPEFQATYSALQNYVEALATKPEPSLQLPPPPGAGPLSAPQ